MTKEIYGLISKISTEAGALAPERSGGVPFAFRGVDSTINHLSPFLRENGVIVTPEVVEHKVTAREVGSKTVTQSEVTSRFHFIAVSDGSEHVVTTVGLAQDFSDRSAAQAQSVAFRVALLQTFALPTQQKEPEEVGEEVLKGTAEAKAAETKAPAVKGPTIKSLQDEIKAVIDNTENAYDSVAINALGSKFSGKPENDTTWKRDLKVLQQVIGAVKNGEVA